MDNCSPISHIASSIDTDVGVHLSATAWCLIGMLQAARRHVAARRLHSDGPQSDRQLCMCRSKTNSGWGGGGVRVKRILHVARDNAALCRRAEGLPAPSASTPPPHPWHGKNVQIKDTAEGKMWEELWLIWDRGGERMLRRHCGAKKLGCHYSQHY